MTTPSREEAPELKACPFCEAPGRFVWGQQDHGCVKCTRPGCDAKGGSFPDKRRAIEAWNTRADLANREPSEGDSRLLSALLLARKVADEARDQWDAAPEGMKAGKLLIALSGRLPGYRADIDEIHAAIAQAIASQAPEKQP